MQLRILLVAGIAACTMFPGEPAPVELKVTVSAQMAYAGDSILLSSPQFLGHDDVRVTLADSTWMYIGVRRLNDTTMTFDVPPLMTGTYEFRVELDGATTTGFSLQVGGLASPFQYSGRLIGVANGLVLHDGRVVYHGSLRWDNYSAPAHYVVLDPVTNATWVAAQDTVVVRNMYAAGPSFRDAGAVLDFAEAGGGRPPDAASWVVDRNPGVLTRTRSLPCSESDFWSYTTAEISDTTCLMLTYPDSVVLNGIATVVTEPGLGGGEFRMAPGGGRTVVVMRDWRYGDLVGGWPVFGADGQVAWTSHRYRSVTGAAFSQGGDTVYVVGRGAASDSWVLDVLDARSGALLATVPFGALQLADVLVDPARPRLYVAGWHGQGFVRPVLVVLERPSLAQLAAIPSAAPTYSWEAAILVHGRASGQVHFLALSGGDAIVNAAFDVP